MSSSEAALQGTRAPAHQLPSTLAEYTASVRSKRILMRSWKVSSAHCIPSAAPRESARHQVGSMPSGPEVSAQARGPSNSEAMKGFLCLWAEQLRRGRCFVFKVYSRSKVDYEFFFFFLAMHCAFLSNSSLRVPSEPECVIPACSRQFHFNFLLIDWVALRKDDLPSLGCWIDPSEPQVAKVKYLGVFLTRGKLFQLMIYLPFNTPNLGNDWKDEILDTSIQFPL